MSGCITTDEFRRLDLRVGTVLSARVNRKSRNPAYAMRIDFGAPLGILRTSSQLVQRYTPEKLIGKPIICCVNLPPVYIGIVKSQVRVIAVETACGNVLLGSGEPLCRGDIIV